MEIVIINYKNMTLITIIATSNLIFLYVIYKEIVKMRTKNELLEIENNTLYPVFSIKSIRDAHIKTMKSYKLAENHRIFDDANKNDEEKEDAWSYMSKYEVAELEYKYLIQSNIDILNGKKTIREIDYNYQTEIETLRHLAYSKEPGSRKTFCELREKYDKKILTERDKHNEHENKITEEYRDIKKFKKIQ